MQSNDHVPAILERYSEIFDRRFTRADGCTLTDGDARQYLDFHADAGTLNYGHSHADDVAGGTDGSAFVDAFTRTILEPRAMDHDVLFAGSTGTHSVELAIDLARRATGRRTVISFTNAFHAMAPDTRAVTGTTAAVGRPGTGLDDGVFLPFNRFYGDHGETQTGLDPLAHFETLVTGGGSGVDRPAAVIVEMVQGDGGLHAADADWLRELAGICRRNAILLIVDDVQAGCGRTGPFFSFEDAGIRPDFVCLADAISGNGLPLALTLVDPASVEVPPSAPERSFDGPASTLAAARSALEHWRDDRLERATRASAAIVQQALSGLRDDTPAVAGELRGRGLMQGLAVASQDLARRIRTGALERGLLLTATPSHAEVIRILPPLVIDEAQLRRGLAILADAITACADNDRTAA